MNNWNPDLSQKLKQYLVQHQDDPQAQELLANIDLSKKASFGVLQVASLFGLIYMVLTKFPFTEQTIRTEDIIFFSVILLFNSTIIERLTSVAIGKEGVSLKIEEELRSLKNRVTTQNADIEAQEIAIERLVNYVPAEASATFPTELVSESELKQLDRLRESEQTEGACLYRKDFPFEVKLRRLRTLGLIENQPGKTISGMPETGDLRDYVKTTTRGQNYLQFSQGNGSDRVSN